MSIPVVETDQAPAGPATEPSLKYAWYVVFVLMICFTLSFIDRQILGMLVDPIKRDFEISDTGVGVLQGLAFVMTAYGLYVCYLMLRRPEDLAVEENHVSWAHMYRMMFVAQIGFALAYLFFRMLAESEAEDQRAERYGAA